MTANPSFIFAGLSGNPTVNELMWIADASGAVLPTDSTTALDTGYKSVGLVTTDGATGSSSIQSTDIQSFGSYAPSRTLISSEILTVRFSAQETNKVTAAIESRQSLASVTVTSEAFSTTRGPARDALYSVVVDALDTASSNHIRDVYPSVRLTAQGDQQIGFASPVLYDFTFTAYLDSSGVARYRYVKMTGLT